MSVSQFWNSVYSEHTITQPCGSRHGAEPLGAEGFAVEDAAGDTDVIASERFPVMGVELRREVRRADCVAQRLDDRHTGFRLGRRTSGRSSVAMLARIRAALRRS